MAMTQDSPSRKREYDLLDADDNEETSAEDADFNIDEFLTQSNSFNDPKKRAKMMRKVAMTQATQTQQPSNDVGVQTCGYIKSVSLKNFMCHENFKLNFGRRLNFIIGHNGSGKSAILTAITICLGAKATDTNRGATLKDLIKEGKNTCQIQVVLSNDGIDAFQPEVYGKEIIIERHIKRDGSGSAPYILKSETGHRVSKKKADLDAVLDNFSIAVNNPMSFLSQDAARSFLTASTDDQKYKFFMKGTMMDEILDNLKETKNQVEKMDIRILKMKDDVISLKIQAKEAKKLFDILMSSNDLRERQGLLYAKYFFMEADSVEEKITTLNNTKLAYEESIQEIEENIAEVQYTMNNYDLEVERIDNKIVALKEEITSANQHQTEVQTIVNKCLSDAETAVLELDELHRNIADRERKIQQLFDDIAKEENRLRHINGDSKELLNEQLTSLKESSNALQREIDEKRTELGGFNDNVKETYDRYSEDISNLREQIVSINETIRRIKSNDKDPFSVFPVAFKNAVNAMSRERFDSKPIGPLGTLFTIKGEFKKWTNTLNSTFSNDANTFVVHGYRDQKLLSEILKKHNCHAPVVIRKPERFDYSSGLPHSDYPTVLDALSFKDEDVKYYLIDFKHIESILLVEDRIEGQRIVEQNTHNVKAALSLHQQSSGLSASKGNNGGLKIDPIYYDRNSLGKILPESGTQDTSDLVAQVKQFESELNILQSEQRQISENSKHEKAKLNNIVKKLETQFRQNQTKEFQLQRKLNEDSETGKLEGLQEDLGETQRQLHAYKNSVSDLEANIAHNQQKAHDANALLQKAKERSTLVYQIANETRKKKEEVISTKEFNKSKIYSLQNSKAKRENELRNLMEKEKPLQDALQDNLTHAQQYASKEEADTIKCKTLERVKEMIENINQEVEVANSRLAKSPEEIINDDNYARTKFQEALDQFDKIRLSKTMMNRSVYERLQAFTEARDFICVSADQDFKSSLQFRNFSGNLDFDFKKSKLKMLVSTKNDKKPRHVDSLSGGEKSFSQISLLLATWKPMRSRIKGLDEFDVFMDQVNRKIGMRLMLKKLSEEHNTQTIFITPQDIGQISEMDESLVSIYRMSDPRSQ